MRKSARDRVIERNEVAVDAEERRARILKKTRYIRSTKTGRVFVRTPQLESRPDMELLPEDFTL